MTTATNITTHEALIKDLVGIVSTANGADDALSKARDKHAKAGDQSIRAFAARVSQINEPLDAAAINTIAESVADKIASGNGNVKKARKSEIKLCLEQRGSISEVISELDSVIASRGEDEKKINLRAAALSTLRKTKKGENPKSAVKDFLRDHDHVKSDVEKMRSHVDALLNSDLLNIEDADGEKDTHPAAAAMLSAISLALGGDFSALDDFAVPSEPEEPEAPETDVMAELGIDMNADPGFAEEAEPEAVEEIEPAVVSDDDAAAFDAEVELPETDNDDDDIAAALADLTRGLL